MYILPNLRYAIFQNAYQLAWNQNYLVEKCQNPWDLQSKVNFADCHFGLWGNFGCYFGLTSHFEKWSLVLHLHLNQWNLSAFQICVYLVHPDSWLSKDCPLRTRAFLRLQWQFWGWKFQRKINNLWTFGLCTDLGSLIGNYHCGSVGIT